MGTVLPEDFHLKPTKSSQEVRVEKGHFRDLPCELQLD